MAFLNSLSNNFLSKLTFERIILKYSNMLRTFRVVNLNYGNERTIHTNEWLQWLFLLKMKLYLK